MGVDLYKLKSALANFKGIKRRFTYVVKNDDVVYIDDYAHHPEELRVAISSARELFPNNEITAIFQPHLFSRTQDFVEGFAEVLSLVDTLVLLDIYPAREMPIEGVTSQWLLDKVSIENKYLLKKEEVVSFVKDKKIDVLMTLGAGDISTIVDPIKEVLDK